MTLLIHGITLSRHHTSSSSRRMETCLFLTTQGGRASLSPTTHLNYRATAVSLSPRPHALPARCCTVPQESTTVNNVVVAIKIFVIVLFILAAGPKVSHLLTPSPPSTHTTTRHSNRWILWPWCCLLVLTCHPPCPAAASKVNPDNWQPFVPPNQVDRYQGHRHKMLPRPSPKPADLTS